MFLDTKSSIKNSVVTAKENQITHIVNKIRDFVLNPNQAGDNIKLLKDGFQSYYHGKKSMNFRNEQGVIATLDTKNVWLEGKYFREGFNKNT